jgi:hypothetical protein
MADNQLAPPSSNSLLKNVYQAVVPSNARMLIGTAIGERGDITEKDFSKDELALLKAMYQNKQKQNESTRQDIANKLNVSEKDYQKKPEQKFVSQVTPEGGEAVVSAPISYAEYLQKTKQQLDSFDKTKGKTSINYYDYPEGKSAPTFDSWLKSAWKSYTDPEYRLKTILGSFNVYDTPEGQVAKDQYNFDKKDFYKTTYGVDLDKDNVLDIWKKSNGPVDFLDMLMIKKNPRTSRNVSIKLPSDY